MVGKYRCDSLNEGRRFSKLVWLYRNHSITELEIHPAFEMVVAGKKICTYEADFRFRWNGVRLTEDVKGHETKDFKLKKKLFEALYPKEILVMVNV